MREEKEYGYPVIMSIHRPKASPAFCRPTARAAVLLAACLAAGCAHWREPAALPGPPNAEAPWWVRFNDPGLTEAIESGLGGNLTLRQAWARLEQAQALARQAGAARMPAIEVSASASRSRAAPTGNAPSAASETTRYALNAAASYELDLWGRVASTARAGALDAEAARADAEIAALSLSAEIAGAYYDLRSASEQLALLREQLAAVSNTLRLTETRFDGGQVGALDVLQQREQLAALRTLRPPLELQRATAGHRLAVLQGAPPQALQPRPPERWPALDEPPDAGIPADLLLKRPDIRAAWLRLRAADERVAAAAADRLPALRLTASGGAAADDPADLFDNWIWNLAAGLAAPLIDGGRRRAEVDRTEAVVRERAAAFAQRVLEGFRDVEDALAAEAAERDSLRLLRERREAADQTHRQSFNRYVRGLSDYLSVLVAQSRLQSVERDLVASRRRLVDARLRLHRALGGTWTVGLQPPADAKGDAV